MKVTMIAPDRAACGVADYTRYLVPELARLVDVAHVVDPARFRTEMNDVDVAHLQHQYFLFGGVAPWRSCRRFVRFARRVQVPLVLTAHEFVRPVGNAARRAAIALTNRLHFRHPVVKRIIVHTLEDRQRMASCGIPVEHVSVVRHGVPTPPSLPGRKDARRALGVDERFVVTIFGFLSRRKGHLLALEALTNMPSQVVPLLAGGQHPDDPSRYADELQAVIARNGLEGRARMTGYLDADSVAQVMSATDLALAPFTESSGSGSLALALACGKPILASDIGPNREIGAEMGDGLALFPSGAAEHLARCVRALMTQPDSLEFMARSSLSYADAHSYARAARETVEVYRSALAEGRK